MNKVKEDLLSLIPVGGTSPITLNELVNLMHLNKRQIKRLISELREDYPICSKETDGGGYWIATNEQDVKEFIKMIRRRRDGYNNTISTMESHIIYDL